MKKVFALILSLILAVSVLAVPAAADAATDAFGDYLVSKFENYTSGMIDISAFVNKYGWDVDEACARVSDVYYSRPELFYVNNRFGYTMTADRKKVTGVEFQYTVPRNKLAAKQKALDDAAKKAVAGITDDMTDVDKALYIHDYLILNCRYDYSMSKRSAYDCLVDGTCVCQGYSLAYSYILNNYLGIECTGVYSNSQTHMWNYVKIGRNWYHVDLTLDEVPDSDGVKDYDHYGRVVHDNFLMSDKKCRSTSSMHSNWRVAGGYAAATDTSFDNAFWNGINTAVCYDNGNYYYITDGGKDSSNNHFVEIRRYSVKKQTVTLLAKLRCRWFFRRKDVNSSLCKYGDKSYTDIYSSIAVMNGKIYFNSNKSVYSYNISNGAVKKIFTLNKGEEMQIFGMARVGEKLRIAYRKDVTFQETFMKLVLG